MGPTWSSGIKDVSDGRRGHLSGEEENQGKLYGIRGDNGSVLPSTPHGVVPRNSPDTDQRGRRRGRRFIDLHGDIRGVLSVDPEAGGMPGGRMSGKGKHPGRLWEHFMY